jgi:hypothetical protein
MSDANQVMETLDAHSAELNKLSNELATTERLLGGYTDSDGVETKGVEAAYEAFLDVYECGCWDRHDKDGDKLPSEAMRLRLARREMPTEMLGTYSSLVAKRKRIEKRIGSLKTQVSAQQSILSALKLEAESSGAGLRRVA